MRGKEQLETVPKFYTRITPAYAGKSDQTTKGQALLEDHPRVCGEKWIVFVPAFGFLGSPPRMRGKVRLLQSNRCFPQDHPRVCGEKAAQPFHGVSLIGSPPRMRGKGALMVKDFFTFGITPAYAGKRLKRSRSTVSPVAIVPLFPSVCNKPVVSDGSPAVRDVPLFLPAENAVPASPACNLRSL